VAAETRLVNLTPHTVDLVTRDGARFALEASGTVARVVYDTVDDILETISGSVRVVRGVGGRRVVDLPAPVPGTMYVVSRTVLDAVERDDVACPTDLLRNETGAVVGAGALELRSRTGRDSLQGDR
jgi:hypothetical protein